MVIKGVVAEVHQAGDLNRHFYVKGDFLGPASHNITFDDWSFLFLRDHQRMLLMLPRDPQSSHFTQDVVLLELLKHGFHQSLIVPAIITCNP